MNKKILVTAILFGSLTVSGIVSAQSVYPGQHQGKLKKETVAPLQAESFDLKDVCLLPSRFRDNMLRDSAWMTSIDVNRLLHSFFPAFFCKRINGIIRISMSHDQ